VSVLLYFIEQINDDEVIITGLFMFSFNHLVYKCYVVDQHPRAPVITRPISIKFCVVFENKLCYISAFVLIGPIHRPTLIIGKFYIMC